MNIYRSIKTISTESRDGKCVFVCKTNSVCSKKLTKNSTINPILLRHKFDGLEKSLERDSTFISTPKLR